MSQSIQSLKSALSRYFDNLLDLVGDRVPLVASALNAVRIGSRTRAQLVQEASGLITEHAANVNNPHDVTAENVDSYRTSAIQTMMGAHASSGLVPIDRYGALDNTLPVVQGSFQGVGSYRNNGRAWPMILEDDGTLRFLRVGTDCNTIGVYHGYVRNALAEVGIPDATQRTPRRYRPSFFPEGVEATTLYFSDQNVVAGALSNGDHFIALTGQTMDETNHVGCLIEASLISNYPDGDLDGNWGNVHDGLEVVMGPDAIYLIRNNSPAAQVSDPLRISISTVSLNAVMQGGYQTPVKLTGWTTHTFYNELFTDDSVIVAGQYRSDSILDKPLFFHGPGLRSLPGWWANSGYMNTTSAFHPETGKFRIRCAGESYVATPTTSTRGGVGFSYVVDIAERTAVLDEEFQNGLIDPPIYGYQTNSLSYIQGSIYNVHWNQMFGGISSNNYCPTMMITSSGYLFGIGVYATSVLSREEIITRSNIVDFTTAYDYLKPRSGAVDDTVTRRVRFQFGSPVGVGLCGPVRLDDDYLLCWATGSRHNGMSYSGLVHARIGPDHVYYSVFNDADRAGRAPAIYRQFVSDLNLPFKEGDAAFLVNEWDGTRYRTHNQQFNKHKSTAYRDLTPALAMVGQLSISQSILTPAIEQACSLLIDWPDGPDLDGLTASGTLVVPNGGCSPFLMVTATALGTTTSAVALVRADVTVVGNQITSIVVGAIVGRNTFPHSTISGGTAPIQPSTWVSIQGGALTVYREEGGWVVTGYTGLQINGPNNAGYVIRPTIMGFLADDQSTKALTIWNSGGSQVTLWAGIDKDRGVATGASGSSIIDHNFRIVYRPWKNISAATWSNRSMDGSVGESWVLIGQDLPEGFVVYFGEETPVILNGRAATLPIRSIDLTDIKANPANTTFYLYVESVGDSVDYRLYVSYLEETTTRLYIGTIVTDSAGIYSTEIDKVTRFGGYRISTTPRGNSIPATTGLPSQSAHLDPEWIP